MTGKIETRIEKLEESIGAGGAPRVDVDAARAKLFDRISAIARGDIDLSTMVDIPFGDPRERLLDKIETMARRSTP